MTETNIEQKSNGTIVRIKTQKSFSDRDISSFINKHGWFYLTIVGGIVDTSTLNKTLARGIIHRVESDQINKTAQIALKLRSEVISHEWYQNQEPNEIVVTLRTALDNSVERIKEAKDRWMLDVIVLDAGQIVDIHAKVSIKIVSDKDIETIARGILNLIGNFVNMTDGNDVASASLGRIRKGGSVTDAREASSSMTA